METYSSSDRLIVCAVRSGGLLMYYLSLNEYLLSFFRYAIDDTVVSLRGVTLSDNTISRGSVVFVVASALNAYQVGVRKGLWFPSYLCRTCYGCTIPRKMRR